MTDTYIICTREDNSLSYTLTENGKALFDMHIQTRQLKFAKIILKHKVFRKTLELYLKKGEIPSKAEVVPIMKKYPSAALLFAKRPRGMYIAYS